MGRCGMIFWQARFGEAPSRLRGDRPDTVRNKWLTKLFDWPPRDGIVCRAAGTKSEAVQEGETPDWSHNRLTQLAQCRLLAPWRCANRYANPFSGSISNRAADARLIGPVRVLKRDGRRLAWLVQTALLFTDVGRRSHICFPWPMARARSDVFFFCPSGNRRAPLARADALFSLHYCAVMSADSAMASARKQTNPLVALAAHLYYDCRLAVG